VHDAGVDEVLSHRNTPISTVALRRQAGNTPTIDNAMMPRDSRWL
jgi:hypothetical protein